MYDAIQDVQYPICIFDEYFARTFVRVFNFRTCGNHENLMSIGVFVVSWLGANCCTVNLYMRLTTIPIHGQQTRARTNPPDEPLRNI